MKNTEKGDRVRELERRVEKLEKNNEELRKIVNYEIRNANNSFRTFKDIMLKMQEESKRLKDKPMERASIESELEQRVLNPMKIAVKENFEFFRKAAKEDLVNEEGVYESYEEIMKKVQNPKK